MTPAKKSKPLTPPQRAALERLVQGLPLWGHTHCTTINHLRRKRLIEGYAITDAGRAAIAEAVGGAA